jgi:hypothetical protein
MVEIAGESHVVDVGVPALFPGDHVMRLAPVRRLIAGGETTSAVSRGEGAALGCGGDPAGPAVDPPPKRRESVLDHALSNQGDMTYTYHPIHEERADR